MTSKDVVEKEATKRIIQKMKLFPCSDKVLTHTKLAEVLQTNPSYISLMHNGRKCLTMKEVKLYSEHFGVEVEKVLSWGSVSHTSSLSTGNSEGYKNRLEKLASIKQNIPGGDNNENRRKFVSGLYVLYEISNARQFDQIFQRELESEFLETGVIPDEWRKLIARKTDLQEYIQRYIKIPKKKVESRKPRLARTKSINPKPESKKTNHDNRDKEDSRLSGASQRNVGRSQSVQGTLNNAPEHSNCQQAGDDFFKNLPAEVIKALLTAGINFGTVRGSNLKELGEEVFIGTLTKMLTEEGYKVTPNDKDKIVAMSKNGVKYVFAMNTLPP